MFERTVCDTIYVKGIFFKRSVTKALVFGIETDIIPCISIKSPVAH